MFFQMNYAIVVLAGILLFALLWWYISGRKTYIGPRVKAQLVLGEEAGSDEALAAARAELDGTKKKEVEDDKKEGDTITA